MQKYVPEDVEESSSEQAIDEVENFESSYAIDKMIGCIFFLFLTRNSSSSEKIIHTQPPKELQVIEWKPKENFKYQFGQWFEHHWFYESNPFANKYVYNAFNNVF